MLKLLIAVDGAENTLRAVRHVVEPARRGVANEAVLLTVQPPAMSREVGTVAPVEVALQARATASAEALGVARRLLDDTGVPATARAATSDAAEGIVAAAADLGCDGIVMGRRGLGALAGLVLGSVSSRVVGLARVPVTLVR